MICRPRSDPSGALLFLKSAPLSGGVLRESNRGDQAVVTDEGVSCVSQPKGLLDRQARAAKNQALFREINERVHKLEGRLNAVAPAATSDWFCECVNESCFVRITMPHNEYDAIREDGARFFVAPSDDHVWPDVERITEQTADYWIVEKMGEAERLAKRLDPRSRTLPLKE